MTALKNNTGGAVCGGIISQTQWEKDSKRFGIWANMMAYILPDKQYKKYILFKKQNKDKEATKIFEKYAISQI